MSYNQPLQGSFTSTAANVNLVLPASADWLRVVNYTQAAAQNNGYGFEYFWQRNMPTGYGTMWYHPAGDHTVAVNNVASIFNLFDSSLVIPESAVAVTGISADATPVVSTGTTTGLVSGDTVRLYDCTGAAQLGGIEFTVGTVVDGVSFTLAYCPQVAAAGTPGTNAVWRKIPYDTLFAPRTRYITKIDETTNTVTFSTGHGYTIGQKVRFTMPRVSALAYGMTELDGVIATVISATTSTITIDVDLSGYTTFAFPLTGDADPSYKPAMVSPVGENGAAVSTYGGISFQDSVYNTGAIGMTLKAGTTGPAGNASDVVYWRCGTSFNI